MPSAAPAPALASVPSSTAPAARHAMKVARVRAALATRSGQRPLSLRKASVAHQVPKASDRRRHDDKIDLGDLTEILDLDPVARTCTAESGVTFADLVRATLAHGLVPIVVPELPTITVGGAVAGCSLESTSFANGGFHDTCLEYEVVTARGEVLVCRPDGPDPLLFAMMHGSFGTLGILTRLTFRLMPARRYVHLTYQRHPTLAGYLAAIRDHADRQVVDFIDGFIHAPNCHALALGRFVDVAPYIHRYDRLKIYHQSTRTRHEDYLTTPDYLFRYDRGVTNVRPRSLIGRALLGKIMTSTRWLALAARFPWLLRRRRPTVTVDLFVPLRRVPAFMAWYQGAIGFYPLWCVPYRRVADYPWLADEFWAGVDDDLFVDLAIYGLRQPRGRNIHRELEVALAEFGGVKTLISHNYYSRDEFWALYDRDNYQAIKQLTDPDNRFRDLYDKTCRAAMGRPP